MDPKTEEVVQFLIEKNWNYEFHDYNEDCSDKDIAIMINESESFIRQIRVALKGRTRTEIISDCYLRALSIINDSRNVSDSIDLDFWISLTRDSLLSCSNDLRVVITEMDKLLTDFRQKNKDPFEFYVANNDWNTRKIMDIRAKLSTLYRNYTSKIRSFEIIADELRNFLRDMGMPEEEIEIVYFEEGWNIEGFLLENTTAENLPRLKNFAYPRSV